MQRGKDRPPAHLANWIADVAGRQVVMRGFSEAVDEEIFSVEKVASCRRGLFFVNWLADVHAAPGRGFRLLSVICPHSLDVVLRWSGSTTLDSQVAGGPA